MMRSGEAHTAINLTLLEIQHRLVDGAVREQHAAGARIVEPPDFFKAENLLEEFRLLFRFLAGDGGCWMRAIIVLLAGGVFTPWWLKNPGLPCGVPEVYQSVREGVRFFGKTQYS